MTNSSRRVPATPSPRLREIHRRVMKTLAPPPRPEPVRPCPRCAELERRVGRAVLAAILND